MHVQLGNSKLKATNRGVFAQAGAPAVVEKPVVPAQRIIPAWKLPADQTGTERPAVKCPCRLH